MIEHYIVVAGSTMMADDYAQDQKWQIIAREKRKERYRNIEGKLVSAVTDHEDLRHFPPQITLVIRGYGYLSTALINALKVYPHKLNTIKNDDRGFT